MQNESFKLELRRIRQQRALTEKKLNIKRQSEEHHRCFGTYQNCVPKQTPEEERRRVEEMKSDKIASVLKVHSKIEEKTKLVPKKETMGLEISNAC